MIPEREEAKRVNREEMKRILTAHREIVKMERERRNRRLEKVSLREFRQIENSY